MRWSEHWQEFLLVAAAVVSEGQWWYHTSANALSADPKFGWTPYKKLAARERTRELWYHGYNNYMNFAFPLDELTPLSCSGQGPDWGNPDNIATNDVAGNFSLTLIDVLDTFIVLDDRNGFETAVKNVIDWVSFDVNTKPQVFETTIRVLGGLLSGHIFANQTGQRFHLPWYRGELLDMAYDLGVRLLPAFSTPTGLPYARINLRRGITKGETRETCTAGAGSLMLEFATLSRLTGDDRFEKAAYKAFFGLWNRKSSIGLVGNTINTWTGVWTAPEVTGIGAGIDSFYEYALKWYILSGDLEFLDVWDDAYTAVMRYSRALDGFWYRTVNMYSGDVAYNTIDSLSAFWPGLQVLAGDIQSAIKLHLMCMAISLIPHYNLLSRTDYNIWRGHSGLPEVYDTHFRQATSHQYPLRPEFVESTWYLYRATRDPFYLDVGERVLNDIIKRAKVDCGLCGISDLRTNERDDRMESFALSETLKYLYLLFDEGNPLHSDDSNYVFTTEGHILTLGRQHMKPVSPARRRMRRKEAHQCPVYSPFVNILSRGSGNSGLTQGIRSHNYVDYARELVGLLPDETDNRTWSHTGWCEKPQLDIFSYDFILSSSGKAVAEDLSPSLLKLGVLPDGFIIHNVTGIRTHIVKRLDGQGYDVSKDRTLVGHYSVRPGHLVYINDSSLFHPTERNIQEELMTRNLDVKLKFFIQVMDPVFDGQTALQEVFGNEITKEASVLGSAAFFGADLSTAEPIGSSRQIRFADQAGLPVYRDPTNIDGCSAYGHAYTDSILFVQRGGCTFLEKLVKAREASAAGVIVLGYDDSLLNPTANDEEIEEAGNLDDVALVYLPRKAGLKFSDMFDFTENSGSGQLMVVVDPEGHPANSDKGEAPIEKDGSTVANRILYLNGLPLLNTRLLV
ncbi:glycoside hydrolase family 47 protein [Amanita thiersii Skay4041]|uniref:alpha-1,2-Mannosidase n=1 Tax=Amanita thiersii Skay4041 TaxID=703135 RepID=A0A2A9NUW5_9AGAR|nr:glycoside hydrolase family 47 protein [Amanita thiersii Skay4041]